MKPDWKDAPEWANWVAMDADGEWFWFSAKPRLFMSARFWQAEGGMWQQANSLQQWPDTLEARPQA